MKKRSGYRYVVDIPMGYETARFVSKNLYPTLGRAIDAVNERYPESEYPDAVRSTLHDEEIVDD
jgi:hypothetical protein